MVNQSFSNTSTSTAHSQPSWPRFQLIDWSHDQTRSMQHWSTSNHCLLSDGVTLEACSLPSMHLALYVLSKWAAKRGAPLDILEKDTDLCSKAAPHWSARKREMCQSTIRKTPKQQTKTKLLFAQKFSEDLNPDLKLHRFSSRFPHFMSNCKKNSLGIKFKSAF